MQEYFDFEPVILTFYYTSTIRPSLLPRTSKTSKYERKNTIYGKFRFYHDFLDFFYFFLSPLVIEHAKNLHSFERVPPVTVVHNLLLA